MENEVYLSNFGKEKKKKNFTGLNTGRINSDISFVVFL